MRIITRTLLALVVGFAAFHAPDAAADSQKLLTNRTGLDLSIVLVIRAGADPRDQAGTQDVHLAPHQSLRVRYGNLRDIYLNGIRVFTTYDGERIGTELIVVTRGSGLDNELNSLNSIDIFQLDSHTLRIHGHNS